MIDLPQAVCDIAAIFDEMRCPYAIMGGLAVRMHGIPRPTYDVDFTASLARDRLPEFYSLVRDAGYTVPEAYESGWVDEVGGMPLIKVRLYLPDRSVDVDIFLAESAFQEELLKRRSFTSADTVTAWFVSPEDLILLKLIARRERDLLDIQDVLFIQGQVDEAYMRPWAKRLGVERELEIVLAKNRKM